MKSETKLQQLTDQFLQKNKFPSNLEIIKNYINRCWMLKEPKNNENIHCVELVAYILKNSYNIKLKHYCDDPHLSEFEDFLLEPRLILLDD